MKKSLFFLSVFGFSAMAGSACLTDACAPNEMASTECVNSNNLCTVAVLKADCTPAVAACGNSCKLYADKNDTTRYCKTMTADSQCEDSKKETGIAWADVNNPDQYADKDLNNCACTSTACAPVPACQPACV